VVAGDQALPVEHDETETYRVHRPGGLGADRLLVLIDGALAHAVTRPDAHPALAARALAELVLDQRPRT
jgi:hypothetical protein